MISFFNPLINIQDNKNISFSRMGQFISRCMNFGQTTYVVVPSNDKYQKTIRVYQALYTDKDEPAVVVSLKEKGIKILLIGATFVLSYALSPLFLIIPSAMIIANGIFLLSNPRFEIVSDIDADLKAWIQDPNAGGDKEMAARRIQKAFVEKSNQLNIGCLGLTTLPSCLGKLTSLKNLLLYSNLFTSLPEEIGNLTNLKKLDLSYNSKLTTFQNPICQLKQLKELDLSGNNMNAIPKEIEGLKELTRLDMCNNLFTEFPTGICELKNLTYLNLAGNGITEIPMQISQLTNLNNLHLRNNKLQSLTKTINQCTALKYLELSENEFIEFPKHILQHPSLLKVQLIGNRPELEEPKNGLKRDELEVIILSS